MAELITIARPYAEAVFGVAHEDASYEAWSEVLAMLAHIAKDQTVADIVTHPKIDAVEIMQFLREMLDSRMTDKVQNLIATVLENRRFAIFPHLFDQYEMMRAEHENVAKVTIETAFAMDDKEVAELKTQLEKHFKRKIEAKVTVHSELIGGIRVTVGDQVMDASVRGKLSSLAASLKS